MCMICQAAIDAAPPTNNGATADAWARADAAIKAWRATEPDVEFDTVLDESLAWCDHMDQSKV